MYDLVAIGHFENIEEKAARRANANQGPRRPSQSCIERAAAAAELFSAEKQKILLIVLFRNQDNRDRRNRGTSQDVRRPLPGLQR
jgi:hypothetical protein